MSHECPGVLGSYRCLLDHMLANKESNMSQEFSVCLACRLQFALKLSCLYTVYYTSSTQGAIELSQWAPAGTSLTMHTLGPFGLCILAHDISEVPGKP